MNHSSHRSRETESAPYSQQRITWLASITSLWRHLSLATEAADIYRTATTVIAKAFQVKRCAILRYDEAREELVAQSPAYGLDAAEIKQIRFLVKEGSVNRSIWERGESLIIDDLAFDPRFKECRELGRSLGIRSVLTYRLETKRERLGTVMLADKHSGEPFSQTDVALLRILAEQTTVALVNTQTLKIRALEAKRGRTLNQIANLLHSTLDQNEIMDVAVTMTMMALRADRCHFFLIQDLETPPISGLSLSRSEAGQPWKVSQTVDEERARWFAGHWKSFDQERPTIIEDVFFSPIIPSSWTTQFDIKTLVLAPLQTKDLLWGYIMLEYHGQIRRLEGEEIGLIEDIANQSALALSNALAYQDTQQEVRSLRSSATVYAPLVEGASAGILVVQDGRYHYCNGGVNELLGYAPEEMATMYLLDIFTPHAQPIVLQSYERILEGKPVPGFEAQALRGDGREIRLVLSGSLIEYSGAPAVEFIACDITEQRREMDHQLLDSKLEAVTQLIGNLVGEARNALTPVVGFAELTLGLPDLSPEVKGNLQTIVDGAERVKRTFDQLATWAQFRPPEKTELNVNHLLEQILALRQYQLQGHQIEVQFDVDKELPKIQADRQQFQMVFLAIIDNARDSLMELSQGRRLLIQTRKRQSDFWRPNEAMEISFSDNGAGIARENISRVFDPFFSTKPPTLALGLGLWISYQVIKNHGGEIEVDSQQGEGATFVIRLPFVAERGRPTS